MKKKFSKYALEQEWKEYQKWFQKQEGKGLAVTDRAWIWTQSLDKYLEKRNTIDEGFTKSSDILQEMKRMSYEATNRQIEHLTGEIQDFLDHGDDNSVGDFLLRFGEELPMVDGKIDTNSIVLDNIRGTNNHLHVEGGKYHGWYGTLAEMMNYIETIGYSVSWNS